MIIIGINDYAANTIENQAARDSHSQITNWLRASEKSATKHDSALAWVKLLDIENIY